MPKTTRTIWAEFDKACEDSDELLERTLFGKNKEEDKKLLEEHNKKYFEKYSENLWFSQSEVEQLRDELQSILMKRYQNIPMSKGNEPFINYLFVQRSIDEVFAKYLK